MTTNRYLTDLEIAHMANAAFIAYEYACDWSAATRAAREYAIDELGVRPSKSAVLLAVKQAKVSWMKVSMDVKAVVEGL